MANDEVLAAVERRREASNGQSSWDAIYGDDAEFDEDWDARDLADAYLARLDAEAERERMRAEPVTEGWLNCIVGVDGVMTETDDYYGEVVTWIEGVGDIRVPMPDRKGEFIDLLRGLGIEAKREGGGG